MIGQLIGSLTGLATSIIDGKTQIKLTEAEIKKNKSALETQKQLEQLKIDGKSQILQQESAIKEKLMQLEFQYAMQLKQLEAKLFEGYDGVGNVLFINASIKKEIS